MLAVMEQMPEFKKFESQISDFKTNAENVSRQLAGWARSLQNSDIEGQRYLNDQTKSQYDRRKRRDAFEREQQAWRTEFEAKLKSEAATRHKKGAKPQ